MKIYAIIGESQQTVVEDNVQYTPQPNEILMQSERPEGNYRATADGTWEDYSVEELAEQERLEVERIAEAQRVPDLEDATVDLAMYIAELEERIAALEGK